ncbi:MAG: DNA repair protein RecO [Patescibacteria group bacterium]
MSHKFKTQGIVLKKNELLNLDNLVTIFTLDLGKIVCVAKGIKKLNSRRAPHIQTGNLIDVGLSSKHDRYYLQESNIISGFSSLKKNAKKMSMAYYFFLLIDKLLPENEPEHEIYNTTLNFLIELSKTTSVDNSLLEKYVNNMLIKLGYVQGKKKLEELHSIVEDLLGEKVRFFVI